MRGPRRLTSLSPSLPVPLSLFSTLVPSLFLSRSQSSGRIEVDVPFRELGFQGVPFRSNVLLQPTTDTLVFLTEPPFLVLTLAEIEIAHLERVQYGLKNFDLVFVFQDFARAPVHINTIPSNQLDNVKEWLECVPLSLSSRRR